MDKVHNPSNSECYTPSRPSPLESTRCVVFEFHLILFVQRFSCNDALTRAEQSRTELIRGGIRHCCVQNKLAPPLVTVTANEGGQRFATNENSRQVTSELEGPAGDEHPSPRCRVLSQQLAGAVPANRHPLYMWSVTNRRVLLCFKRQERLLLSLRLFVLESVHSLKKKDITIFLYTLGFVS
jgi:hypothetical protein